MVNNVDKYKQKWQTIKKSKEQKNIKKSKTLDMAYRQAIYQDLNSIIERRDIKTLKALLADSDLELKKQVMKAIKNNDFLEFIISKPGIRKAICCIEATFAYLFCRVRRCIGKLIW